jgi:hypothetical protein
LLEIYGISVSEQIHASIRLHQLDRDRLLQRQLELRCRQPWWPDIPLKNKLYRFSHAIDLFDPTQLFSSGAVLYYTPDAWPLLQGWLSAIDKFPNVDDDPLLDYTYNFVIEKNLIRASWWDKDYCRYSWWIHVRPVIDHPQFPATDNPMTNFKSVAGYERFKPDSIKHRQSEAPFPRDCLIDTTAKCLRRSYSRDRAIVVGRFTTDLWIEPDSSARL